MASMKLLLIVGCIVGLAYDATGLPVINTPNALKVSDVHAIGVNAIAPVHNIPVAHAVMGPAPIAAALVAAVPKVHSPVQVLHGLHLTNGIRSNHHESAVLGDPPLEKYL